MRFADKWTT